MRDTRRFVGFELELTTAERRLGVLGLSLDGRLMFAFGPLFGFFKPKPSPLESHTN
jgi:hypothetical protein